MEFRWGIPGDGPRPIDPNYQLLLGRLFDHFHDAGYTFYEPLPATEIPASMSGHIVQHRFRTGKDSWPLVQLGQGILTVNDVENYDWDKDYFDRCVSAIGAIYEKYPANFDDIPKHVISLKYIDAYAFDYNNQNLADFLKSNMSLDIGLPDDLIHQAGASGNPVNFVSDFTYETPKPKGTIRFRVARGERGSDGVDLIVWETEVRSSGADTPVGTVDTSQWLQDAHTVTSDWFFKLIEGNLEKEFSEDG